MCLTIKHPQEARRKLPKEFVAYKVVKKRGGSYYPPVMDTLTAIKKHNVARILTEVESPHRGGRYRPYYHSFKTKAACDAVSREKHCKGFRFIKIKIKRKDVTCTGGYGASGKTQYLTIVSKAYTTEFEEYVPRKGR